MKLNKLLSFVVVVVFIVGAANSVWAFWGSSKVDGIVKNVGTNAITVNSSQDGQDLNLQVNDKTKLGGSLGSLSELKEGDQVKISYKKSGDQKIATLISKESVSSNPGLPGYPTV